MYCLYGGILGRTNRQVNAHGEVRPVSAWALMTLPRPKNSYSASGGDDAHIVSFRNNLLPFLRQDGILTYTVVTGLGRKGFAPG
jgi:hypothetical protein